MNNMEVKNRLLSIESENNPSWHQALWTSLVEPSVANDEHSISCFILHSSHGVKDVMWNTANDIAVWHDKIYGEFR